MRTRRITGGLRQLLGAAVVLLACGGESRSPSHGDATPNAGVAGLGGAAPGGAGLGGAPSVPRLNGVPIGDCREPTDDERTALGCPDSPPRDGDPCDLAQDVTCAYSLSTKDDNSYQDLHLCSNDPNRTWWELLERCGEICTDGGPHVLELDATDCTSRPADDCKLEGSVYAYAPSDHTLLSEALRKVIQDCAPGTSDLSVTLELTGGCATRFSTTRDFSETATACLREKLGHLRFACGEHLPCVSYNEFTT